MNCEKCKWRKWKALKSENHGGRIGTEYYCALYVNFGGMENNKCTAFRKRTIRKREGR